MRHILTLLLTLVVATVAEAATVTGTIQDANGDAVTTRVEFWPLTAPLQSGDALIVSGRPVRSTATNGVLSVSLAQGLYQVRIGSYDKIKISVPSGSGTYEIGTLTSDGITYIPPVSSGDTISVSLSPTNYTTLSTNLETHLAGIDVALAEAGGAVDLTGTNDLASTGTLLNAKLLTGGGVLLSTNITDHNTAQYAGALIVSTNIPMTTDWMGQSPYQLVVAGTDGVVALVGTEEGGHTTELEFAQIDDADGSFVDKWALTRLGNADGAAIEFAYSATDPYDVYTEPTNIIWRLYPAGYAQVRGHAPIISMYDDTYGTSDHRHWGIVSDDGKFYITSYDTFYYSNPFTALTVNQSGDLTVAGDIANTGTLSVSNSITANNAAAFGGLLVSTTNRTLTAATVLNPAPVQIVAQGTEGAIALVGGPEGNFADTIDFVETSEDGTTLTDKWTLAKRTYSSNSAMAYYYGPNADMGSNTNVYYMTTAGDTWNKRNSSIGGSLTVATNVTIMGRASQAALTISDDLENNTSGIIIENFGTGKLNLSPYGIRFYNGGSLEWSSTTSYSSSDTHLYRDSANTLALRNGTASNTFRVYGTYTDSSNYARSSLSHDGTSTTTLAGETAGTGSDDQSLKIQLAGNGALYVEGDTAGNARGSGAVDLQVGRSAATQVASGIVATIIGGADNVANGAGSSVVGGSYNVASSTYSTVAGGRNNQSTGYASVAMNAYNTSSGRSSSTFGEYANAYLYGQQSYASGQFSTIGDAQGSRLVARGTTTGSSADLLLAGVLEMVLPANTTWMFEITVSARSTDGGSGDEESAAYKYIGCIERDGAGNTALVGTVTETVVAEDDTDWSVVVSADDTNDALDINVTSDDANTVRWVAVVTLTEVGG